MTKKSLIFLSLSFMVLSFIFGVTSVNAKEIPSSSKATTEEVAPHLNIVCPACGATGYPTGKVITMPARSVEDTPQPMRLIGVYQEMQCSANSSHIWYEYIADLIQ